MEHSVLNIIFLILGLIAIVAALYLLIKPVGPASLISYASLWLLHWSYFISVPDSTFRFWGIGAIILLGLRYLKPFSADKNDTTGNLYLTLGGLAGMVLGMAINASLMVLGTIIGTFIGQMQYVNTPKGARLKFPTSIFIHYFCAVELEIIFTLAMIGIAFEGFIRN